MPEVKININRCKGCSLCTTACPQSIIQLTNKINLKGYQYIEITDISKCVGCGMCANICPDVVIEVWK